ncbi:MAG: alpha/beta fold hydrolase [Limnobacter sp.]|nr:alpha/beta fold hydrolase [Limnobacter sp.]
MCKTMLNALKINAPVAAKNAFDRFLKPSSLVVAGQLPWESVYTDGLLTIRHYKPLLESHIEVGGKLVEVSKTKQKTPIVMVAPLAINMLVFDLQPERSFIKYLLAQGFEVYLIDWGSPTRKHASYTLETYIKEFLPECLTKIREHANVTHLTLHGWSMGGGMALAHAAASGCEGIQNIVTLGTPIDGHANGAAGRNYERFSKILKTLRVNLRKFPGKVFYTPAWANVIGFKILDPVSAANGYFTLIKQLHNREFVANHANQAAFNENLESYPGGALRDWFCSIWMENETKKGQFTLGKEKVQFSNITCPVLCVAGKSDALSNVPCTKGLMPVLGRIDKEFFIGPGGHIGIVTGKDAVTTIWPKTTAWLKARDHQAQPVKAVTANQAA